MPTRPPHSESTPQPPAELTAAWTRRLRWHYDLFNENYLAGELKAPVLEVRNFTDRLGQWSGRLRTLAIGEAHILQHSWEAVLDTLRHEMAHQYVEEVLDLGYAPPHGDPFQYACRLLRCDPSPTAAIDSQERLEDSNDERDRMMHRIRELLALAESPNEHEAANAMRMAHRYLLKYNLDLAQVEGASSYENRFVGLCSGRIQEYQYVLSEILQEHFFILPIWTFSYDARHDRPGRILQISGTRENVEMASYVHDYVMQAAARLWQERKPKRQRKSPTARPAKRSKKRSKKRGTKLQYMAGLLCGFQQKLEDEKQHLEQEHGLVWLGDPELGEYFRNLHPRTRSVSTAGVSRNAQYHDGMEDGKQIKLRRGIDGASKNRGRLLPDPGS